MAKSKVATVEREAPKPVLPQYKPGDFGLIKGQESVKRALTVVLAGHHSVVLIGPTGHGKSMLINAAQKLLEQLNMDDLIAFQAEEFTVPLWIKDPQHNKQLVKTYYNLAKAGDIHVEVPAVPFRELFAKRPGSDSASIASAVSRAWDFVQSGRPRSTELSDSCLMLMKQAYDELGFTPAGVHIVIDIARTIADLEESENVTEPHLAEAVQYRLLDQKF